MHHISHNSIPLALSCLGWILVVEKGEKDSPSSQVLGKSCLEARRIGMVSRQMHKLQGAKVGGRDENSHLLPPICFRGFAFEAVEGFFD